MRFGEPVVLPDQLVGSVVLVCDRGASPGDRGYVIVTEEIIKSRIANYSDSASCYLS